MVGSVLSASIAASAATKSDHSFSSGFLAGFLAGIDSTQVAESVTGHLDKKPLVMATIKPLALMVKSLAGDDFEVGTLLPPSANPHALAMSIADRKQLANADLVVWLGPSFERFMTKPMLQHRNDQIQLGLLANLRWPGKAREDLHLWLDPFNVAEVMKALAERLSALAPSQAGAIQTRLSTVLTDLSNTEIQMRKVLEPFQNTPFLVNHDGYGHFAHALTLNQRAAATRLPEEKLSARKMYELQLQLDSVPCLIVEPDDLSGQKLAETLHLPFVVVDPLGRSPEIDSITQLLQDVTAGFVSCYKANDT
jgi:zinc transport system substrate-binding protein